MRVVICWAGVSGYMAACWRALAAREGVDLLVVTWTFKAGSDIGFDKSVMAGLACHIYPNEAGAPPEDVARRVIDHRPDVVAFSGWSWKAFTGLLDHPSLSHVRFVMGMDTPKRAWWKSFLTWLRVGRLMRRVDRVMVSSERTWQYARYLGVPEQRIRRGVYGFDYDMFAPLYEQRIALAGGWPKQFLYMGRYAPEKGIVSLLQAYGMYRSRVSDPWPLACCGMGALAPMLVGVQGVKDHGFIPPDQQPPYLLNSGAFVIASRYEPWGVAIAEAQASGLPIICTEACSAGIELVRPYFNGLTTATDNPEALANAFVWIHQNHASLPRLGKRGQPFAAAFSAQAWTDKWHGMFEELLATPK